MGHSANKSENKLAFLFPGQGSQYVGMGAYLYQNHPKSRAFFDQADAALGYKISEVILQGPLERLTQTEVTQPALLTVSVATANYLIGQGIRPDCMAGHSLGEYSALVVGGALDFADAVKLVRLRGQYMQEAVPAGVGTMAAIIGPADRDVDGFCEQARQAGAGLVEPAGYNCPGQVVVAGEVAAVKKVMEIAAGQKARAVPLNVSAPFHCSMLKGAADKLTIALSQVQIRDPKIPYFSNVDAQMVSDSKTIAERLAQQVCKPVRWSQTLMNMFLMRTQKFIEAGPGRVCVGHLKKVERRSAERAAVFAITDKEEDIQNAAQKFGSDGGGAA